MATSEQIGDRVARVLDTRRRNVQYRWIQRLVTCEPYALRPNLPLPAVLGQIAAILDGLSAALRAGWQPTPELREETLRQAVRRHAQLRAAQGFHPEELVAEFRALRCEVWHVLGKELMKDQPPTVEACFILGGMLDYAIDTLLVGAVAAWREVEVRGRS